MRKELSWLALSVQSEFPTEALADFKTPCPFSSVCAIHGSCIFGPIRTWDSPNHTYFMTPWVLHKLSHSHPARQNEFISCWPGIYIPRIFIHPSSPIPCLCPLQWLPGCHLCVQLWFGLDQKTKFKKKKKFFNSFIHSASLWPFQMSGVCFLFLPCPPFLPCSLPHLCCFAVTGVS